MNITLNGQTTHINAKQSIQVFLQENGYADKLVAVAVNGSFVPRSDHAQTLLQEGDEIDIVAPMQGG